MSGVLRRIITEACSKRSSSFTLFPGLKPMRGATDVIERVEDPLVERPPIEQRVSLDLHAGRQHAFLAVDLHVLAVGTDNDAIERSCLFEGRRPGAQALHLVRSQGGLRDADHCAPIFAKLLIRKGAVSQQYTLALADEADSAARGQELGVH